MRKRYWSTDRWPYRILQRNVSWIDSTNKIIFANSFHLCSLHGWRQNSKTSHWRWTTGCISWWTKPQFNGQFYFRLHSISVSIVKQFSTNKSFPKYDKWFSKCHFRWGKLYNGIFWRKQKTSPSAIFQNISTVWRLPVVKPEDIDTSNEVERKNVFTFDAVELDKVKKSNAKFRVMMTNNIGDHFPVKFACDPTPIDTDLGIIYASIVLLGLYILIIWEVRTLKTFL